MRGTTAAWAAGLLVVLAGCSGQDAAPTAERAAGTSRATSARDAPPPEVALAPADGSERAAWFFSFAQPGDVVEIVTSEGRTLSAADGDIYDCAVPWDEWQAGSALK